MEIILKCPFFGCDGQLNEHDGRIASGEYTAQVICGECDDVKGAVAAERTKELAAEHAIKYWNTRYQDETKGNKYDPQQRPHNREII